ncbi:MAG: hypothetical protein GQ551_11690 [Myxococcales bacterium]|nr:hypothetical protein [Myxococcales bacterium]
MHSWHDVYIDEERMSDDKGIDDKIIAVSANDPVYQDRSKLADLPEHKEVVVEGMQERDEALKIPRDGLVMYRQLRRGELTKD